MTYIKITFNIKIILMKQNFNFEANQTNLLNLWDVET